jgi:tight adherence protein B
VTAWWVPVLGCAVAAVLLALPGPGRGPATPRTARRRLRRDLLRAGSVVLVLLVAALLAGGPGAGAAEVPRPRLPPAPHLLVLAVALGSGAAVLGLLREGRRAREAALRRVRVIDFCEALVGELHAGRPLGHAVERAAGCWEETAGVVAAARLGADVPQALRALGAAPGAEDLRSLASAWALSAATGSGLARSVEQVLDTARAAQGTLLTLEAELASARATARMVVALPLVVLVAAQGLGGEPWRFLLDTLPGALCLAGGAALSFLGLSWINRIARDVRSAR